jgi:succinate-acetate transporter protein
MDSMDSPQTSNGRAVTGTPVARVMLRPIGSPLPLGVFALVPTGLMLAGVQLEWFAPTDIKTVGYLLLGFAVPLQFSSSILAFLGRDTLVGTSFGIFTGTWLAFGLNALTSPPGHTSAVLGVFFLAICAIFAMLMGGGLVGGKAGAGIIVLAGSARFLLSGLYELTSTPGVEHAAGIVGLVFVAVAAYVGFASLIEDSAHRTILPIGRRGTAKTSFTEGLDTQLDELEHEAGVRQQL